MVTKWRSGSERVKRNSRAYFASERASQGAFACHPTGMALPTYRLVEPLDRGPVGPLFALLLPLHPAGAMSRLSLLPALDPVVAP
jgi:hypothetical protein